MILFIYNKLYETQMNELKLFRVSQGYQVITYLVSENDHYFSIKNYIDNLYNTNNNLKYVLIFGNIEDVPTLMKSGTGESSQYQTSLNYNYTSAASDISYATINDELKLFPMSHVIHELQTTFLKYKKDNADMVDDFINMKRDEAKLENNK